MAVQFVIRITFLLLLTYGLAEAAPPIGKSGCKTRCGNVTNISYPFGMGPSHCYMDDWFEIVCNGSGAFLKRINMEVLEITITSKGSNADNTVRVKSPIISSNPSCTSMSSGGGVNCVECNNLIYNRIVNSHLYKPYRFASKDDFTIICTLPCHPF